MYLKRYDVLEPEQALWIDVIQQALRDIALFHLYKHPTFESRIRDKGYVEQAYEFFEGKGYAFNNIIDALNLPRGLVKQFYWEKIFAMEHLSTELSVDEYKLQLREIVGDSE